MMDLSEVRRIVDAALEPMASALWVREWEITPVYLPLDDRRGQCDLSVDYLRARIELDPASFDCEDDVLSTLRHELIHVQQSEWWLMFRIAEDAAPDANGRLNIAWHFALERHTAKIERMLDSMGYTPRVLAGLEPHPLTKEQP